MRYPTHVLKFYLKLLKVNGSFLLLQCFQDALVLLVYLSILQFLSLDGVSTSHWSILRWTLIPIPLQNTSEALLLLEGWLSCTHSVRILNRYFDSQPCVQHPLFDVDVWLIEAKVPELWLITYVQYVRIQSSILTINLLLWELCSSWRRFLGMISHLAIATVKGWRCFVHAQIIVHALSNSLIDNLLILKWQFQAVYARLGCLELLHHSVISDLLLISSWTSWSPSVWTEFVHASLGRHKLLKFVSKVQSVGNFVGLFRTLRRLIGLALNEWNCFLFKHIWFDCWNKS